MFNSILIVCTGNICRSPVGERLLRKSLPGWTIDSAGTAALISQPADPVASLVAKQYGLSLTGHRSRQFTPAIADRYSLILVMEKSHITSITRIAPVARGKSMLLGHWLPENEISDPYLRDDVTHHHVFHSLSRACDIWVQKLRT